MLYEDKDILVVDKPAGLLTVGTDNNKTRTSYYMLTDYVRKGNPVEFSVDTYPSCNFTGVVDSISAGSDSQFSALPAENASGNWVKVVQRVPVRIRVTGNPCNAPLRAGLSTVISIDTGHRRWSRLLSGD